MSLLNTRLIGFGLSASLMAYNVNRRSYSQPEGDPNPYIIESGTQCHAYSYPDGYSCTFFASFHV